MPNFFHSAIMAAVLATAAPSTVTDAPPADAARLLGAWDCSGSARGSTSTLVYSRTDDAAFALQATVHTAFGVTGNVTESFAYDRKNHMWTLSAARNRFFDGIRLTAKPWTAKEWVFSGTESTQGTARAVRIVYAFVAPDAFLRQHQTSTDGRWLDDGALTCRRAPGVAVRQTPAAHAATTPSSRPSMQPAVASLPRGMPAPPATGASARSGATPTPLPIPGIVPAQVATAQPPAARSAAARSSGVPSRASSRPDATPVAQSRSAVPSGMPNATVRPSSVPAKFSPSPAVTLGVPIPSAEPTAGRIAAVRPSSTPARSAPTPAVTLRVTVASAQPVAARIPAARASSIPARSAPSPAARAGVQVPSAPPSAARIAAVRPASVPARSSPHPAATPAGEADRAYRLTGNVWSCETLGGLPATHTYTRQSDGEIKLRNVLTIAKHQYGIDETYHFDSTKNVWSTTTGAGAYVGVAPKWLHDKWVFDGTMLAGNRRVPVQMIYSTLGDSAFRRDFIKLQDGTWKTFAAETCHRP